ncbi:MAG: glycosyltransferase family 4 protein, partial [Vicinamibacterales bacterium]
GLEAAHMVVAPTAAMGDALATEYGLRVRPLVIPNACADGDAAREPNWTSKEPVVLTAGRAWDHAKNVAALCAIASRVTWPIYVAGSQRTPEGVDCPLPGVRALGCLTPADLSAWFRRASIYVLPARYEPFGLSVLEAARAGCALVLGDIASLRENWDGVAVFVPPDDTGALASVLRQLIDDPEERFDRGKRAFARADAFSIDRTAREYLRVYEGLMA